jgi:2-oxoglutarate dehydrogenase E1 component
VSSLDDILLSSGLSEEMFRRWEKDPLSVDPSWRKVFEKMEAAPPEKKVRTIPNLYPPSQETLLEGNRPETLKSKLKESIRNWRVNGHKEADINPFKVPQIEGNGAFSSSDLETFFPTEGLLLEQEAPLKVILEQLDRLYKGKIGFEFAGIVPPEEEAWMAEKIEKGFFLEPLSLPEKQMILEQLAKSELFETFMHTKYVGQKRFSIEGAESLIPMLEEVIEEGSEAGVKSVVIGMAHRGRLNVLSNILNKPYQAIFAEFEEGHIPEAFEGTGDVKYHKGYSAERTLPNGKKMEILLPPNPSHLESIDSVVEGIAKGKQVRETEGKKIILPILIHGDGAIAGQGVVYETLQMQSLPGFSTGGTIHFVINNQIGFTTGPEQGRSTRYCTDIAKAFGNPVLHVNGEDPEAAVKAAKFALLYRSRFQRDIFIDLYCYRKYGHNEGDEPAFTHPELYRQIKAMKPVRQSYQETLLKAGLLEQVMVEAVEKELKKGLNEAKESLKLIDPGTEKPRKQFPSYRPPAIATAVVAPILQEIGLKLDSIPEGFTLHPKVHQLIEERKEMAQGGKKVNWGMAEMLAYGSLLLEGHEVRIAGQDVERGTFSHRHAVYVDQQGEEKFIPLAHLSPKQARFSIFNSTLSEYAALGFEYGYSLSHLNGLTIWEAQFGDFANGGQVIFDQYLAPAEEKWGQRSPLTCFLPHGYEGQGPEHSSGRIERFLALAGERNLRIAIPSLPSQQFHLLRRQTLDPDKKPLIIFTPKGLLRLPAASSSLDEFTQGEFHCFLDDPHPPADPKKVVFCSGKIYFELKAYGEKIKDENTVIIRIEQLYPFYEEGLKAVFERYKGVKKLFWVQEEPENMGAAFYIVPLLETLLNREVRLISRPRSATTAAGIYPYHKKEVRDIMENVFLEGQPTLFDITGQVRA